MGGRDSEADSVDGGGSEVDGGRSEVDGGGEVRLYHDTWRLPAQQNVIHTTYLTMLRAYSTVVGTRRIPFVTRTEVNGVGGRDSEADSVDGGGRKWTEGGRKWTEEVR